MAKTNDTSYDCFFHCFANLGCPVIFEPGSMEDQVQFEEAQELEAMVDSVSDWIAHHPEGAFVPGVCIPGNTQPGHQIKTKNLKLSSIAPPLEEK